MRAGEAAEVDPRGVVALGRVGREDARAGIGRPPRVAAVAQQHPSAPPGQFVRGGGADQPAARDHHVVALDHRRIMPDRRTD